MPRKRSCLLLALSIWLLPAATLATPPAASQEVQHDTTQYQSYTVQAGDTLVGIAKRYGLTSEAVAKLNALDQPHRIAVGNVLRLPVTRPEAESTPSPTATAANATGNAAKTAPHADTPAKVQAAPPAPAATPAQAAGPDETPAEANAPARLAVGVYANPVMGTLRIAQTPTGIAVTRDNQTIAMRHLLYGVFDGADAAGLIHGLRLEYDASGQVAAVLYNSGGSRDVTFTRVRK